MNKQEFEYTTLTKNVAKVIHEFIYSSIKLSDQDSATFVAGALIALENENFRSSYKNIKDGEELVDSFISAIHRSIDRFNGLNQEAKPSVKSTFDFIKYTDGFNNTIIINNNNVLCLKSLLELIEDNIYNISKNNPTYDILSEFYNEFSKYSSNDQSSLGIVPTPHHIARFMTDLLEVGNDDVILDTCCGTSSLLLSAADKGNKVIGVELQPRLMALTVANMIIRESQECNLTLGNSWEKTILDSIKQQNPTRLIINPPYAQDGYPELGFVKRGLDCLVKDGLGIVILPMATAIKQDTISKNLRKDILKEHQLLATFSMPDQLFYPVGVVTIIMLFKAHNPNEEMTFFGFLKDDGFEITRTEGRKDTGKWLDIKNEILNLYNNFEAKPGKSAIEFVSGEDEWCCEAYMQTNYNDITQDDFIKEMNNYILFNLEK